MSNIQKILADEIRRLARKEVKSAVEPLLRQLKLQKAQLADQAKLIKSLSKSAPAAAPAPVAAPDAAKPAKKARKSRFRPAALVAFRKKFSLTQRQLASLLSTSLVSVTNWENGHAVPRAKMLEKINSLRKLGKRGLARLLPPAPKKAPKQEQPAPTPPPAP